MESAPFIEAACPCGARFLVRGSEIGQKVRCTSCWREFVIAPPAAEGAAVPGSPAGSSATAGEPAPSPEPLSLGGRRPRTLRRWLNRHDPDHTWRLAAAAVFGFVFGMMLLSFLRSPLVSGRRDRPPVTLTLPITGYVPPVKAATPVVTPVPVTPPPRTRSTSMPLLYPETRRQP